MDDRGRWVIGIRFDSGAGLFYYVYGLLRMVRLTGLLLVGASILIFLSGCSALRVNKDLIYAFSMDELIGSHETVVVGSPSVYICITSVIKTRVAICNIVGDAHAHKATFHGPSRFRPS